MRFFTAAAALVLAATSLATARAVPNALDRIKAAGVLKIGTTGDYRPCSIREADGNTHGADIEMARKFAASLGVKAEIVPTAWGTLLSDFTADKFDIASINSQDRRLGGVPCRDRGGGHRCSTGGGPGHGGHADHGRVVDL